jgi:serine protease Do
MKCKISFRAAVISGILVLTSGLLLAQKGDHHEARTRVFTSEFGGVWMGVHLNEVTAEKARELKLPGDYGAVVTKVEPDSPSAKAGLQANDVILEFDGERVRSVAELRRLLRETPPDRQVSMKVSRAGQLRDLNVTLEARRSPFGDSFETMRIPPVALPHINIPRFDFDLRFGGGPRLGIRAQQLTPQLASYFGVREGKGVLVAEVKSASPAEKAGLKAGDCIIKVDSTETASVEDLQNALDGESSEKPGEKHEHTITIVRDHREQSVKVEIESRRPLTSGESAEALLPEESEPPEIVVPELEGLDDQIAELRAQAPQLQLEAEALRRQWQNYKRDFTQEQLNELRKQAQELGQQAHQAQTQIKDQVAKQLEELKRRAREQKNRQEEMRRRYEEQLKQEMRYHDTV